MAANFFFRRNSRILPNLNDLPILHVRLVFYFPKAKCEQLFDSYSLFLFRDDFENVFEEPFEAFIGSPRFF